MIVKEAKECERERMSRASFLASAAPQSRFGYQQ